MRGDAIGESRPDDEPLAGVVRSGIHDRTWIAHIMDAEFANTPAGPLRLVKAEVEQQVATWGYDDGRLFWRHDGDEWVYTFRPAAIGGHAP